MTITTIVANNMDISVIIPLYNGVKYIRQTLESILAQEFSGEWEIVITDDISTDDSPMIISDIQQQYRGGRIKYIKNDHRYGYFNYAIAAQYATGKYLAVCDQDDIWIDPLKLQKQFDHMDSHPDIGMTCTYYYTIIGDNDSSIVGGRAVDTQSVVHNPVTSMVDLFYSQTDIMGCTMMVRAELFARMIDESDWVVKNNSFFDSAWAYWFAIHSKIYCIPEVMSAYRILEESGCHSKDDSISFGYQRRYFLNKVFYLINSPLSIDDKMEVLKYEYDYLARNAAYSGQCQVRKSRAYLIGKKITTFCKCFKNFKITK